MDDRLYYTWQSAEVGIRSGTYTLFEKPGMVLFGRKDIPATLLADEIETRQGDTLLVLNCGAGLPGLVAAEAGARVIMADANVVAVQAARQAVEANGSTDRVTVVASSGTRELPADTTVDVAALLLPKGRAVALQHIWDAYRTLKPGGRFFIAGANAEGAKTYIRYAEDLFGPIAIRAYRKGCRVGAAVKSTQAQPIPSRFQRPWLAHDHFQRFEVDVRGNRLYLYARPGVFSWDRLDTGTGALLTVMQIDADDHVLDLGCGVGIVGTAAAKLAPHGKVLMLDADINAVVSSRATVEANGITNAMVELSDCASVVVEQDFDVVLTNPPFHQGKATQYDAAYQFIRDAGRLLRPGGRFYLVANRFIPYEDAIRQCLGQVDTIHEDRRFKVLLGRK